MSPSHFPPRSARLRSGYQRDPGGILLRRLDLFAHCGGEVTSLCLSRYSFGKWRRIDRHRGYQILSIGMLAVKRHVRPAVARKKATQILTPHHPLSRMGLGIFVDTD